MFWLPIDKFFLFRRGSLQLEVHSRLRILLNIAANPVENDQFNQISLDNTLGPPLREALMSILMKEKEEEEKTEEKEEEIEKEQAKSIASEIDNAGEEKETIQEVVS